MAFANLYWGCVQQQLDRTGSVAPLRPSPEIILSLPVLRLPLPPPEGNSKWEKMQPAFLQCAPPRGRDQSYRSKSRHDACSSLRAPPGDDWLAFAEKPPFCIISTDLTNLGALAQKSMVEATWGRPPPFP